MEVWKEIPGYNGGYLVSDLGRIKSLKGRSPIIKKPTPSAGGYLRVNLSGGSGITTAYVHKLVAEAFVPNPGHLPEVNHKDENKENNLPENLEWCSAKYNRNYGSRNSRISETMRRKARERKNHD